MKKLFSFLAVFLPQWAMAATLTGLGSIAENILQPVNILSDFICTASIIVGASFLFGAFLRYMQHRVNPLVAPMSTIIVLLVVGTMLVGLPFIYLLTENGIPFSLASL